MLPNRHRSDVVCAHAWKEWSRLPPMKFRDAWRMFLPYCLKEMAAASRYPCPLPRMKKVHLKHPFQMNCGCYPREYDPVPGVTETETAIYGIPCRRPKIFCLFSFKLQGASFWKTMILVSDFLFEHPEKQFSQTYRVTEPGLKCPWRLREQLAKSLQTLNSYPGKWEGEVELVSGARSLGVCLQG